MQLPNYDEILKANTTAKIPLPDNEKEIVTEAIKGILEMAGCERLEAEQAGDMIGAIVREALHYGMPPREAVK